MPKVWLKKVFPAAVNVSEKRFNDLILEGFTIVARR